MTDLKITRSTFVGGAAGAAGLAAFGARAPDSSPCRPRPSRSRSSTSPATWR